jgi:polysaccharide pyruvyl transferase WcaK-like protein
MTATAPRHTSVALPVHASAPAPRPQVGRVLALGAFGQGNPGDEALLAALCRALPEHGVLAASADPAATTAEHGIPTVHRGDLRGIGRRLQSADAVVVAGGTIFKTLHPSCGRRPLALLRRTAAIAAAARLARRPLALIGVGAAPLRGLGAGRLARGVIRAADLLVLRDEESAAVLADAGATAPFRVGADLAWTVLEEAPPVRAPADGPVVVALSHLAGGRDLPDRIASGLAPLVERERVVLLPWQDGDGQDTELGEAIAARVPGVELAAPPADLVQARDVLAGARAVLGMRFHALVAAAVAGRPFAAFAHEPKLEGLARRLGQPAARADAAPDRLTAVVRTALAGPPPTLGAVRAERARAVEGFRLLRVLLARGRSDEAAEIDGLDLRPEEWLG